MVFDKRLGVILNLLGFGFELYGSFTKPYGFLKFKLYGISFFSLYISFMSFGHELPLEGQGIPQMFGIH